MARKKKIGCACDAHNHSLGKTDIKAPEGKDVSRLFAAAGGFTGSRLIRKSLTKNPNSWLAKYPPILGLGMTALGVIGFANFKSDTARYVSLGFGMDGVDTLFSTIPKVNAASNPFAAAVDSTVKGIGSLVQRHLLGSAAQPVRPSQAPVKYSRKPEPMPAQAPVQQQAQVLVWG